MSFILAVTIRLYIFIALRKSGAGEGIRTLDPNLGKVVDITGRFGKERSKPLDLTPEACSRTTAGSGGARPFFLVPQACPATDDNHPGCTRSLAKARDHLLS